MDKESNKAMPGCGDAEGKEPDCICPTTPQLFRVSWDIMWRYMVVGAVFMLLMTPLYMYQVGFIMRFLGYVNEFKEAALASGYWAAITLHPYGVFLWFICRLFLGYLITWWIFSMIITKNYGDFSLNMETPEPSETCTHVHCKGVQRISWAFYWRFVLLLMILFTISLHFIRPDMMIHNFWTFWFLYMALAFLVMPIVLRQITNRPLGCHCGCKWCPCSRCRAMYCEKECHKKNCNKDNPDNCAEHCKTSKCTGSYVWYIAKS